MALRLENAFQSYVQEANPALIKELPDHWVQCFSCGHRCKIPPEREGICKVRYNQGGKLLVPSGYIAALQLDPIEKKPFFHALPGASALSFGMLGCDFHCGYCQNWITSQALRDPSAIAPIQKISAPDLAQLAKQRGAPVLASTYNEPLITSEWAVSVFKEAKKLGLRTAYISNGNATPEVLDFIQPWIDLYKVDLKSFRDSEYRKLGGKLETVLWTIQELHRRGIWLEIVTLIVPQLNDSKEELDETAKFIASVSKDLPWHVTAFHPDYKMTDRDGTTAQTLLQAYELGRKAGLHYVYAGNLPGRVGETESTFCPKCSTKLIHRIGYQIVSNQLLDGACPKCQLKIPGLWH